MKILRKVMQWARAPRIRAVLTLLATIATIALAGYTFIPPALNWINWRLPADGVPPHELTILISQFRSDPDGRYTSEIEAGLLREGWQSVRFRRTLTADELVESSRVQSASEHETVAMLFERHGGDVLITGDVAATGDLVRLRIFEKGGSDAIPVDLDLRNSWPDVLAPYMELAILTGLIRSGAYRVDEFDDEFVRRILPIESKAQELAERATTDSVQDIASEVSRDLSIEIGMNLEDAARLTAAREEIEITLSDLAETDSVNDRIAAMSDFADLSRAEALALGDSQLLDRSFVISRQIRQLLGVAEDDFLYPEDFDASPVSRGTLEIESSVALACRDLQRVDELLQIYERVASCDTDRLDTACPMWSTRAIFALRYGRAAWSLSGVSSLSAAAFAVDHWARVIGYGRRSRHWADPMTHADRLLRARLGVGPNSAISPFSGASPNLMTLSDSVPDQDACPNLIRLTVLPISPIQQ